jgi:hypothetical protein
VRLWLTIHDEVSIVRDVAEVLLGVRIPVDGVMGICGSDRRLSAL